MLEPPKPSDEAQRLTTLRALQILDTPAEERFDRITRVAKRHFDVPIALVSLVDSERQWFKSCIGLPVRETPRSISFCGHAILGREVFVIENALNDTRFADNPLVTGDPSIRFYAGCPLQAVNHATLGTLCIIDRAPRQFSEGERQALLDLGHWASQELSLLDLGEAAARARDNEARLRAVVDNVIDGIITFDAAGTIESVNTAALDIFARDGQDLIGRSFLELMAPDEREKYLRYLREYLESGQARILGSLVEGRGLRPGGEVFPIEFAVTDLQVQGRHLFTAIVRDITERKRLERMKNEFISTVSHELRTPLTSIRGSLGLLAGGAIGELSAQGRSLVEIACNNSERLVRLINDILDIEKIASGKMTLELMPVDIDQAVQQAMATNRGFADQHGVRFGYSGEPLWVQADTDRLQQVLTNLLSNAIKFSSKDAIVDMKILRDGRRARLEVIDHGSGVPREFRSQLFQKFAQADGSDARRKGGSGLGLSITKAIVERMGGRIGFHDTSGGGATFYVELPLVDDTMRASTEVGAS